MYCQRGGSLKFYDRIPLISHREWIMSQPLVDTLILTSNGPLTDLSCSCRKGVVGNHKIIRDGPLFFLRGVWDIFFCKHFFKHIRLCKHFFPTSSLRKQFFFHFFPCSFYLCFLQLPYWTMKHVLNSNDKYSQDRRILFCFEKNTWYNHEVL